MPERLPKFYKNLSIAVVLSFFWPGLGQIYNGKIGKAYSSSSQPVFLRG
jgi:TM2 domain-containing membrane protein YozV